ncbi:TPA: hypothetical protein DEP26_01745 [Candidatus Uhrbacteria bacterium]|nr:hypothetical protein [Candidatus Uhrbacteria bacterium]
MGTRGSHFSFSRIWIFSFMEFLSENKKKLLISQRHTIQRCFVLGLFLLVSLFLFAFESQSFSFIFQEDSLKVWMFDVGQGDALFLELPTGEQILIDGGPDNRVLSKLGSVLFPWDRSLDYVVATHADADHITGLVSVLENYDVSHVVTNGHLQGTGVSDALQKAIEQEKSEQRVVHAGQTLTFGDVILEVLWPSLEVMNGVVQDRNETSLVFLLTYGKTSILFTGDAEEGSEFEFATQVGDVDVVKVGHHGSASSTSHFLLDQITPEVALVSAGKDNSYGHPHPIVLQRLFDRAVDVFRTDQGGDILLRSVGQEPNLEYAPLPF